MNIAQNSMNLLRRFIADEKGLSAVEYGLLAAGIAIGLYAILSGIGADLRAIFSSVKGNLDTAAPAAGG
ncbi:MAG TPA: Flp family type IVb pilin [Devosia sp.]|nr:Flp family type IVb pilin [Devosia sp.]